MKAHGGGIVWLRLLIVTGFMLQCGVADTLDGWPAWRGPAEKGSTGIGTYPSQLNIENAEWKLELPGKGGSTPITAGDRIILTTPSEDKNAVMAVDFNGKVLWTTTMGTATPPRHRRLGSSCNSSPVTDGKSVFVYFKSGDFAALDLDGAMLWHRNLIEEFGPEELYWDQGSSPVVNDTHVFLARMHAGESWIAAFEKSTGKITWKTPRNYRTPAENDNGYTTPILYMEGDRQALLLWGADHLTSYDAATGELLWWCGGFNPEGTAYWPAIASPVIVGDMIVVPVGRDDRRDQAHIYGVRTGGKGDVSKTHVIWDRQKIGVFVSALAASDGKVFLLRNKGGIACVNPSDGGLLWEAGFPESRHAYYSSPVIAKGVLYAARNDGMVFSARVGDTFTPLHENDMGEELIASPVPVRDRILIRGEKTLFCFR